MTNKQHIIGIDAGATHSTVCIWEMGKKVYEKSDWPGMNMDLFSGDTNKSFIDRLSELSKFGDYYWVIALAGVDDNNEEKEASIWWKKFLMSNGIKFSGIKVLSDIELVIWAGSDKGIGIGLIAGTGSNSLGRDEDGRTVKVGGMSHILSDEGGGFSLAWEGLHLVTKMSDGRVPKTSLLKNILNFYNVDTIVDLKNYLIKTNNLKAEVAKTAPIFFEAVDNGDQEVLEIIDRQSLELVNMITTINRRMSPTRLLPVFLAGSLFRNEYYKNKFIEGLGVSYPEQKINRVSPIDGVVSYINSLRD